QRIRFLISTMFAVCVLAVGLAKPLSSRADNGTTPAPPAPAPVDTNTVIPPLPVIRPKQVRKTQLHLPFGNRVVGFAKHLLGTRYVWGGASPRAGFDCSGLVRYVSGHFGISPAHPRYAQSPGGA